MAYWDGDTYVIAEINNKPWPLSSLEDIQPCRDLILVRVIPTPNQHILNLRPDLGVRWGEVVKVGPGKKGKKGNRIPVEVKPGDIVAFGKVVWAEDGGYVLMSQDQILVVEARNA